MAIQYPSFEQTTSPYRHLDSRPVVLYVSCAVLDFLVPCPGLITWNITDIGIQSVGRTAYSYDTVCPSNSFPNSSAHFRFYMPSVIPHHSFSNLVLVRWLDNLCVGVSGIILKFIAWVSGQYLFAHVHWVFCGRTVHHESREWVDAVENDKTCNIVSTAFNPLPISQWPSVIVGIRLREFVHTGNVERCHWLGCRNLH